MKVSIDTEYLSKKGLSPNQWVFLMTPVEERDNSLITPEELQDLSLKDYLEYDGEYKVTNKFTEEHIGEVNFKDVFNLFPQVVFRRRLRPGRASGALYEKLKNAYLDKVRTKAEHERVLKCLQTEIEERESSDGLLYMQMLSTWINQESWDMYDDVIINNKSTKSKLI